MKAKQNIFITLAIVSIILIFSGKVFAHSNNDNSAVPFKEQFLEKLNSKIERHLNSNKHSGLIGLNNIDQKNFNHYGINVLSETSSIVQNIDITFERTSAGLKVTDTSIFNTTMNSDILPSNKVLMQKHSHSGYNHDRLNVEWVFGENKNLKIVKDLFEGKGNLSVGLTNLEQNLLNDYRIKSGNKFQLSIYGHNFLVERNSGGLIIFKHIEKKNIAKEDLSKDTVKDNI